ncbi:MAG: hypothetical protein ACAI25_18550, partial [Planctomycetota bacterium]
MSDPKPALPPEVKGGQRIKLKLKVASPKPGDEVAFTATTKSGDELSKLTGPVKEGGAEAVWVVDAGQSELPVEVDVTATLRGRKLAYGTTKIVEGGGPRVSTLGWLDAKDRPLEVDRSRGKRVTPTGETLFLQFDLDDGNGGAVQDTLDFKFILEREEGGSFTPVDTFTDSTVPGVKNFKRKFTTPSGEGTPGVFRIALEARKQGEDPNGEPSLGRRVSPPLEVIVLAPVVTSFLGTEPISGKEHAAKLVGLGPGEKTRLLWEVAGQFDKVTIKGAEEIDVTAETTKGEGGTAKGSRVFDPAQDPPDADGHYTIVASNQGLGSPPREVAAAGILEFVIAIAPSQSDAKKHVLTKKDGVTVVETIRATPKPLKDERHDFLGQVTPFSKIRLAWRVVGARNVRVELRVNGIPGTDPKDPKKKTPNLTKDLTDDLRKSESGKGTIDLDDPSQGAVLHAQISVTEDAPDDKRVVLARAILHLRENFPMPRLDDLRPVKNGSPVADGASFDDWKDVAVAWTLGGSSSGNHLDAVWTDEEGRTFTEHWKDAGDKRQTSTQRPTGGPFAGKVTIKATLQNSFNETTGEKTVTILVKPGSGFGVSGIDRVIRGREHTPPRICEPFRLQAEAKRTPPLTDDEKKKIKWRITVDGKEETPAPKLGDKLKIPKVKDEWFGKAVVFEASIPGQTQPVKTTFNFDRSDAMEYVQLVEKVEKENPSLTPIAMVDALRRHAGYDSAAFRAVLQKREAQELVAKGSVTQAELDRLNELSAHSGDVTHDPESGIATDDGLGFRNCMGHLVSGMSAGTSLRLPFPVPALTGVSPASSLDPLYAITLSGD